MNHRKISQKIKGQIQVFSGKLSYGLSKPLRRCIEEVIFGIQVRQTVRISEISRALNEPIRLIKTENRISRQLKHKEIQQRVRENLIQLGEREIKEETLLILDLSDITKKYAQKMEYMARVRDGSEEEIKKGYWTIQVIGSEVGKTRITPLYGKLYSQNDPAFESETREMIEALRKVREKTKRRGIWVMDRGGDRKGIFEWMVEKEQRFIIRLRKNRDLKYQGHRGNVEELGRNCRMRHREIITKEDRKIRLEYGYLRVGLCGKRMTLVVVRGLGQRPMYLLSNLGEEKIRQVVWSYLRRWQIEETIRFSKQNYQLEDIRLLTYRRLQNMMVLVMAGMYFTCRWLERGLRLRILVGYALKAGKRLFGIPDFKYYALSDGIREIFSGFQGKLSSNPPPRTILQPSLFYD